MTRNKDIQDAASRMRERLHTKDILIGVSADSKDALFSFIAEHMAQAHGLQQDKVRTALARREMAGSTGWGQGLAVPHARIPELDRVLAAYLRLASAIDFHAADGEKVHDVIVLLVPTRSQQQHLDLLADVSHLFSDPVFCTRLHQCKDAYAVQELLAQWSKPTQAC